MSHDTPPALPHEGPHAAAARAARLEREAAALRDNLRRRKAQARARDAGGDSAGGAAGDSGRPAAGPQHKSES
jgi:hypothetical protein